MISCLQYLPRRFLSGIMGSLSAGTFDVKKIAVIGAGPCGLAAAKYLRAQGAFDSITVFEQQDEVGGVWNYSSQPPRPYPIPQKDPFLPPDLPLQRGSGQDGDEGGPIFPSPMYESLHANIPGSLMRFSDKEFPDGVWAFPKREVIQEYLLEYAEDVRGMIRFCFQVTRVSHVPENGHDRWHLEAKSTVGDEIISETFDAVVMANGHYATPFVPDIKGMKEFSEAHPSVIIHSKTFRKPEPYKGQKVIVVGNGPSGTDIALQINNVCASPALLSVKEATPADRLEHTGCREVPEIVEFLSNQRGVRFADGTTETDVDAIVFCTGFMFSYPFLPDLQNKLITNGKGVHGLYKHFICIDYPTLVFPGLNIKAIPWPLSEVQAAVYSAIWSNNLPLPAKSEMREWSKELEERKGNALHVFSPLEDGYYINEMHDWAMQARHRGKEPPHWDDEKFWERKIYADAKLRFEKDGCRAKTLGELGLYYEPQETAPKGDGPGAL